MKRELKAVIDTNIVVSAVIGKSATLMSIYNAFVDNVFTPVLSPSLQQEIINAIRKPRLRKYFLTREVRRFNELIKVDTLLVAPAKKVLLCRDSKDNILLETALEAKADFIITGDKDLLCLKTFHKITIVTPKEFVKILKKR